MLFSFSILTLIGAFTLSLFLGVLNFWFWRVQREDRTPLWMAAWLSASSAFTFCRLLQYASLSEPLYILVPRILLSFAYPLAWLAYELGNSFINYRLPRWERALILSLVVVPIVFLWTGDLILTDQTVVRTVAFGGRFTGVQTGGLYLPFSTLILALGAIPVVRLARTSSSQKRENALMAAGLSFIIIFSLSDFIVTALGLVWIRFSDFSYLPVAIFFSYIQVQRLGRLYGEMNIMVHERTAELSQVNETLRSEIAERVRAETEILNRTQLMEVLYETTGDLIIERDLSKLLRTIVKRATELLNASAGGLYLCEPEESQVRCLVSYNTPLDFTGIVLEYGEGAAGKVAQTGNPLIIDDYSIWEGRAKAYDGEHVMKAVLSVPLKWQDQIIGVLNVEEYSKGRLYTEEDEKLASSFANQAAVAVHNARLNDQVQQELAERERAQAALLEGRAQLSGIIETAMDGIISVDEDQRILLFNAASENMFRCSAEEAIGQSLDRFIPVRLREIHQEHIRQFGQTGETKRAMGSQLDLAGLRADGEEFPIEASISQIEVGGQKIYTVIHRDITKRKQVEERLRESEVHYRGLFEEVSIGIFEEDFSSVAAYLDVLRKQGIVDFRSYFTTHPEEVAKCAAMVRIVDVNPAALKMYQAKGKEDLLKNLDQILAAQVLANFHEELITIADGNTSYKWEGTDKNLAGEELEVSLSWAVAPGYENDYSKVIVSLIDITERKQAEDALRKAEEKYRSIFENVVEGVHQTTPEGQYLAVNRAAALMLGYDSSEELIASMTDLDRKFYVDPDRRTQFKQALERSDTIINFESQVYRKDGSIIWVSENGRAVRDEHGRLLYYDGTSQDITERKRAEAALQAAEQDYRSIFENAPIGIFRSSPEGRFLKANFATAKIYGYTSPEEMIQSVRDIPQQIYVDSSMREKFQQQLRKYGEVVGFENQNRRKDGSIIWTSTNARAVQNDSNRVIYYEGFIQDITGRKQAEETLRESEKRFATAFFTSPFSQSIITQEKNEIMAVNDACCTLFGYNREELIGASTAKLNLWENPVDRQDAVEELLRTGRLLPREATVRLKSGEIRTVIVAIEPLTWKGIPCLISSIIDITERKQAEKSLRESEEKFRKAFKTSPDSININRLSDGLYIEINNGFTAITGYTAEEVKGKTSLEINIWADPADRARLVEGLRERGEVTNLDASFRMKDGQIKIGLMSARVIQVAGETCILSITRDITKLKQAEEEIRRKADEMAALAEVSQDISSTLDLEVVLERIASYAKSLLEAETSAVYLYEPTKSILQAVAAIGLDAEEIKQVPLEIGEGILGNIAAQETGEIVNDTASDSRAILIQGTKVIPNENLMGMPVLTEDRLTGLIAVWRSGVGNEFLPTELDFLGNLALQVAVAIENARLFENTRRRLSEIEAVHTVSTALRSAQSLDEAMPIILEQLMQMTGAGSALIDLLDLASGEIVTELAHGIWAPVTGMRTPVDVGVSGHVISKGQSYVTTNLIADGFVVRPDLVGGLNSAACVPIMAQHQPIGALWVGRNLPFLHDEVSLLSAIGEMVGNAIHRMILHEQTEHRANKLASLRKIDQAITANVNLADILDVVLDQVQTRLSVHATSILLFTPETQNLDYKIGRGFRSEAFERVQGHLCGIFGKRVVKELRPVHIADLTEITNQPDCAKFLANEGFIAYYGIPLVVKGQLVGVLECYQRSPFNIDDEWISFMDALTGQTAIAIEKTQILADLQAANLELIQAYDTTLEGWAKALELRDKETEGHSRRVTNLTLELAHQMGISEAELTHVHRGVLLHDIGKMGVPDQILKKTGPLNKEEWSEMRKHPQYAYDLIHPIAFLRPALDIPYCHHERWNGSGYPRGLKGAKIPFAARIFAVVDVWDALMNDRPYRKAWSEKKTLAYIKEQSGVQFDPQVVDKFLELITLDAD